jgi:tRNA (guanine-N7-)-methyltransferase
MTAENLRALFRLRSFVRRDSRLTTAQANAHARLWPSFGLTCAKGVCDWKNIFKREAPRVLEIGFGMGNSLAAAVQAFPDHDFIGIETHKPGVGALLLNIESTAAQNLRIFDEDAVDVLAKAIPDNSLAAILVFFPDPWQKRRHHARRLIQPAFVKTLLQKLKQGGELHLATDWEDYAKQMLQVVNAESGLKQMTQHNERSRFRPIVSKFEQRAINEGRVIANISMVKL